ncbi:MAG: glutamate racemase [Syntrophomonadaceae bacterium]|nr:glutamate racemase [Syntrophomonadaceae bacterium]
MEDYKPIGVFDSGVGGLTVVKRIVEELPRESIIYVGDTAHVPYGGKSARELIRLGRNIIDFLQEQEVKVVVAACNTSSSVSLPVLRGLYRLPLLDVISPGARNAAAVTRNGKIGVIATQATVNSQAYTQHIKAINPSLEVYEAACPQFVPLVESGRLDGAEVEQVVRGYLGALLAKGVDTLVLGCTHYPFLAPVIDRVMGGGVTLVDPAEETVNQLRLTLLESGLANRGENPPEYQFFASGGVESFFKAGRLISSFRIDEVKPVQLD